MGYSTRLPKFAGRVAPARSGSMRIPYSCGNHNKISVSLTVSDTALEIAIRLTRIPLLLERVSFLRPETTFCPTGTNLTRTQSNTRQRVFPVISCVSCIPYRFHGEKHTTIHNNMAIPTRLRARPARKSSDESSNPNLILFNRRPWANFPSLHAERQEGHHGWSQQCHTRLYHRVRCGAREHRCCSGLTYGCRCYQRLLRCRRGGRKRVQVLVFNQRSG